MILCLKLFLRTISMNRTYMQSFKCISKIIFQRHIFLLLINYFLLFFECTEYLYIYCAISFSKFLMFLAIVVVYTFCPLIRLLQTDELFICLTCRSAIKIILYHHYIDELIHDMFSENFLLVSRDIIHAQVDNICKY